MEKDKNKKYSPHIPRLIQETYELLIDNFDINEEADIPMWEVFDTAQVNEATPSGLVDGKSVLGRAQGVFFLVDGVSRNKRFYSRKLWENALGSVVEKMKSGRMLGTIGHEQALDDDAILQGKASHKVTKLWIDEGKKMGMGEILILNTPAGQNLNTYLRAGVQFPVSSRGYGQYKGAKFNGCDVVDEDKFHLETFDFVQSPGVQMAIPVLVEDHVEGNGSLVLESKNTEDISLKLGKVKKMDQLNETLMRDKVVAENSLNEALVQNRTLTTAVDALKGMNETLTAELGEYRKMGAPTAIQTVFERTQAMVEAKRAENAEAAAINERMTRYAELGTPEEIQAVLEQATTLADVYEELGSPEHVSEALTASYDMLKKYKNLGSPADIKAAFKLSEEILSELENLGSLDQIRQVFGIMEDYVQIGTPTQIREAFSTASGFANKVQEKYVARQGEKLAKEFGVKGSVVAKMMEKMTLEDTREALADMAESFGGVKRQTMDIPTRYSATTNPMSESVAEKSIVQKSRAQRLSEGFSNKNVDGTPMNETAKDMRSSRSERLFGQLSLREPRVTQSHRG